MARTRVRCKNRALWGQSVFGASGVIYKIVEGGELHVKLPSGVIEDEPGVLHKVDVEEFAGQSDFRVDGRAKTPPKRPSKPTKTSGSDEGDEDGEGDDDKGAEDPEDLVSQLPARSATKTVWLDWAKANGIALSQAQKGLKADELKDLISEKAAEKDEESAA